MNVNVYNLRLRTSRLASILRGVWVVAMVRQDEGGGGGCGGGGILSHHQLHFRLSDASRLRVHQYQCQSRLDGNLDQ